MSERLSVRLLEYPFGLSAVLLRPKVASPTPIGRCPVPHHVHVFGIGIRYRSVGGTSCNETVTALNDQKIHAYLETILG